MAEETLDLRGLPKPEAYRRLDEQVCAVLDGVDDEIAAMATISALVHHAFGHLWTGFYRVVEPGALLRVGPYQGSAGMPGDPRGSRRLRNGGGRAAYGGSAGRERVSGPHHLRRALTLGDCRADPRCGEAICSRYSTSTPNIPTPSTTTTATDWSGSSAGSRRRPDEHIATTLHRRAVRSIFRPASSASPLPVVV